MESIFLTDGRVAWEEGLYFYEKDLVKIRYDFSNDIEIDILMDYNRSGFGFVLDKINPISSKTGEDLTFIQLGNNTFSADRILIGNQTRVFQRTTPFAPTKKDVRLTFKKKKSKLSLHEGDRALGEVDIPNMANEFYLYLYSNEGNVIKEMSIKNNVPPAWIVNAKNTRGGRVAFTRNLIRIEESFREVEIEQHDIELEPGTYYLDANVSGDASISIFPSNSLLTDIKEKNILNDKNSFSLEKKEKVTVRITGKNGNVEKIAIKDSPYGAYVETGSSKRKSEESHFKIVLDEVEKVTWYATISQADEEKATVILETSVRQYLMSDMKVQLKKEFKYVFVLSEMTVYVYDQNRLVHTQPIAATQEERFIKVFNGATCVVRSIEVVNLEGETIQTLIQKTNKLFVPTTIDGPIIVTNMDKEPFDLSASYRVYEESGEEYYQFTNWEREYFFKGEGIQLTKETRGLSGDIRIYGIKGEADWSRILYIKKGQDNVQLFSSQAELIKSSLYEVDPTGLYIEMNQSEIAAYDYLIVDYLKNDSYCINYNPELNMYEVDIATKEKEAMAVYDYKDIQDTSYNKYVETGIQMPEDKNMYVVLT